MRSQLMVINALLWAGMILGISFLESWVKFHTPSLTKAVGLDVGRTVFNYFHKVQCLLLVVFMLIALFLKLTLTNWLIVWTLTFIFILQVAWLFPNLNQRVNVILAGEKLPNSYAHTLYGLFEVTKLLILVSFSMSLML